jgi:long-chain acyl-CoA synthetase
MNEKVWHKSYEKGVPREVNVEEFQSLADLLESTFTKYSSKPAFTNMGKTMTYEEMREQSQCFAAFLQSDLGLKKGDRLAIMMPNCLQYPIALFGALQAGVIVVNVNPLYTARELEHQLKDSQADSILIIANFAATLQKAMGNGLKIKNIIVTELGDQLGFPKSLLVNSVVKYVKKMVPEYTLPNTIAFNTALRRGASFSFRPVKIQNGDIAFLQYTGGTTGIAKGAILTHGNIVANLLQTKAWIANLLREGEEIIITALPLYHIFSLTANCFLFSSIGALNVLITNPRDMPAFIKELKKWPFTAITGVNTLFNGLLNQPDFASIDFSHLKVSLGGGMALQRAVAERWKKVTKVILLEGYGLTETSPIACVSPLSLAAYNGYIGLPIPNTEVDIKGEKGESMDIGEVGEICIRGPQVMKGYWNMPDETAKVMTPDHYFKTGDMGYMNEEGYIKLVDRKKDMILVSGFNVYPNEIEDVVAQHPKVLEVAAVGHPDEHSGEIVRIFVVKKDPSLTEDELKKFCKENLTGYKVPRSIIFRDDLPKTNVGKILRKELKNINV